MTLPEPFADNDAMKLRVASAVPDPPFEFIETGGKPSGFDVELTQAIAAILGADWEFAAYQGADFNGIFAGLHDGTYDLVASGTTVTPQRQAVAKFARPYLHSGQSLAVNTQATPNVRTIDDLRGLAVGIQRGNTSEAVAQRLLTEGKIAKIAWYAYHDIEVALADLEAARIGAIIKLEPVMRALVSSRPSLAVVQAGLTDELIAYAVALSNTDLCTHIESAQQTLLANGSIDALAKKWFTGTVRTEVYR